MSRENTSRPIRRRRDRPPRETDEIVANAASFIRGLGRRVAQGDTSHLALLHKLHTVVNAAEVVAVRGLREQGFSDSEIGAALGVTQQAVNKKWPRHVSEPR